MKIDLATVRRLNIIVAGGISTAYVVGQALNVNNVKKKLQLKTDGKVVPVPPKLQSLIDEVSKDLKLEKRKIRVEPFMSKGSDVKSIGFPLWTTDVYLGIPEYFMFDAEENNQFTVMVDEKEVPQNAPEFKPLKESMTLSTEAKKFGLAHEIFEAQHSNVFPCGVMPMLIVFNCTCISLLLEKYEKLSKKPLHRSNHYAIFFIGAWMYALLYDIVIIFKETESDFLASDLGQSYTLGGIEYYRKMIKRNTIIKKLNKDAPFTEKGDINTSLIRTNHMRLDKRVTYLTDISRGKKQSIWNYILFN